MKDWLVGLSACQLIAGTDCGAVAGVAGVAGGRGSSWWRLIAMTVRMAMPPTSAVTAAMMTYCQIR